MNKSFITRNITTILACILFFSCSSEDDSGILPDEEYPVTLRAVVEQQFTRSTSASSWNGGEEVAVQIGSTVKKHIAATDGKLSVASGTEPFYWQYQSETKIVQAWYPYSSTMPGSWSVQSDQSAGGYQQSDFLYTPATAISFTNSENASLPFYHQTAKVVVNIVNGDAATSAGDILAVVIGDADNLALSGDYTAPIGNATQGTWSNLTDGGIVIPQELTPTGTFLTSYTALIIPQDMVGKKFIAVALSNGNTYYYTPQNQDAALLGGKQYTYNITVKNGYLEVEALTDGQWMDGIQDIIISADVIKSYTATDLKPGDYYYSDGTTSDGGLRRIYAMNGRGGGAGSVAPVNGKTVIGIVFWVGDPTEPTHNNGTAFTNFGDPALKEEKSGCTHGLVVALQYAADDVLSWQSSSSNVGTWVSSSTSYETTITYTNETDALNKLRGYNNTQAIRAYNSYVGDSSPNLVLPVQAIDNWAVENPAPENSSGWYCPSAKELTLLCGQDKRDIINYNSGGTGMRDIVNASIKKVSEATSLSTNIRYWSSSEEVNARAFYVDFYSGAILYKEKNIAYYIRPVLAF